jgi:hypothetical protein
VTALVLTPFTAGDAVELGSRLWRKKLLPIGDVEYKGRMLHFTRDYLGRLVQAFQSGAYDQVPFQLADAQNTHTNDPERTRGQITAMELGDDGLYVTAELTPEGEKVLEANPRLGVSARIVEDYARSDGRHFPAAVQHVLGTLDPRIPGLGAWQAIEAATPVPDTVVDLSASHFAGEATPAPPPAAPSVSSQSADQPAGRGLDMDLTDDQKAKLAKLLELPESQIDAMAEGLVLTPEELALIAGDIDAEDDNTHWGSADGTETEDGEEPDDIAAQIAAMSDEEFAALEAEYAAEQATAEYEQEQEREPVAAGLSAEAQFAIDLANARAEETQREMAVISARLREQDYQAEKRRLADLGVPPFITELARPLLEGAGRTVELANGKTADAGQIMRKVLTEYANQARLLDLDVELGSPMDAPEDSEVAEKAQASRSDVVNRFKTMTGLK